MLEGSPLRISNNVISITLPDAFSSSVIGTYAIGTLLNESGALTVIQRFSRHLSFIRPFLRANS